MGNMTNTSAIVQSEGGEGWNQRLKTKSLWTKKWLQMFYLICTVFLNFPLWIRRFHIKLILISNFFWKVKTSAILGPHSHRAIGPGLRSSSWPLWQAMHAQGPHCLPTDQYAWSLGWSVQVYHLSHALLPTPLNLCRIKRKWNIYWTQISIKSLKTKDASRGLHVSIHPPSFTYLPETDRTEFVTSQPHPNLNNSSSGTKRKKIHLRDFGGWRGRTWQLL